MDSDRPLPPAKKRKRVNAASTALTQHQKDKKKEDRLLREKEIQADLQAVHDHISTEIERMQDKYGRSEDWLRSQLYLGGRLVKGKRAANPYNAFQHVKARADDESVDGEMRERYSALLADIEKGGGYNNMSEDQKKSLCDELEDHRKKQETGLVRSSHVHTQDVSHTLSCITHEVHALNARTGIEFIGFAVKSDALHNSAPQVIVTAKGTTFFETIMNLETTKILLRFQAYATLGIQGTVGNHEKERNEIKTRLRVEILTKLREITKSNCIQMEYKAFQTKIVLAHGVNIRGWTYKDFVNPSQFSSPGHMRILLEAFKSGECEFYRLPTSEWKKLQDEAKTAAAAAAAAAADKENAATSTSNAAADKAADTSNMAVDAGTAVRGLLDESDDEPEPAHEPAHRLALQDTADIDMGSVNVDGANGRSDADIFVPASIAPYGATLADNPLLAAALDSVVPPMQIPSEMSADGGLGHNLSLPMGMPGVPAGYSAVPNASASWLDNFEMPSVPNHSFAQDIAEITSFNFTGVPDSSSSSA